MEREIIFLIDCWIWFIRKPYSIDCRLPVPSHILFTPSIDCSFQSTLLVFGSRLIYFTPVRYGSVVALDPLSAHSLSKRNTGWLLAAHPSICLETSITHGQMTTSVFSITSNCISTCTVRPTGPEELETYQDRIQGDIHDIEDTKAPAWISIQVASI